MEWRELHNEELNDLYSTPNIFLVIKSGRIKWTGHVAHTADRTDVCRVLVDKPEGKRTLGERGRRWKIILSWVFRKWDVGVWTGSIWLGIRTGGGHV